MTGRSPSPRTRRALDLGFAGGRRLHHGLQRHLQRRPPAPAAAAYGELRRRLRRDGIAVVERYYAPETCLALRGEIDRLLATHPERVNLYSAGADQRLFAVERASEPIDAFYRDALLHQIAESFVGAEVLNAFTMAARLTAAPGNLGSGEGWHRDSFETPQIKAILYLTDVGPDEGPFQYVPRSARLSAILTGIWRTGLGARQQRLSEDEVESFLRDAGASVQTLTAPAGTLVLADTSGIHRGMPIVSGCRYALTNYYFPRQIFGAAKVEHFNASVRWMDGGRLDPGDAERFFPAPRATEGG